MVDIGGREEIVRHISVDVRVAVGPIDGRLDAVDLADEFLVEQVLRVGVALDLVVATAPLPGGTPSDTRARSIIDGGALRARAGTFAPEIVVDYIGAARVGAILFAKGGLSESHRGRRCEKCYGIHTV